MPHVERRSHRTTGVTRRRLNPHPLERTFTKDSAIGHAVQCYSSGQTEVFGTGLAMQGSDETKDYLFSHLLNRPREVHVALSQQCFRLTRRATKYLVKL